MRTRSGLRLRELRGRSVSVANPEARARKRASTLGTLSSSSWNCGSEDESP